MTREEVVVAVFLLLSGPNVAFEEAPKLSAQAGKEESLDAEYKQRIDAAKTPEEKARLKVEYDRRKLGDTPEISSPPQTFPGTDGSGTIPKREGGTKSGTPGEGSR